MISAENIFLLFMAYCIGALPFSILAGKLLKGIDIREYGSGNAGATNTFRVLGKKAGIPVLILDICKGLAAVSLVSYTSYLPNSDIYLNLQLVFGITAVLGHIFPVYVGFRGGKGVATLLGFMIGVFPLAAALSISVFVICLLVSKYVSFSSIVSSIFFPIGVYYFSENLISTLFIFSIFVPVLLIATHHANIERLIKGEENKVNLKIKKNK
jgi:acyl phosphate:glycerol-3-phosphate acyltransferase